MLSILTYVGCIVQLTKPCTKPSTCQHYTLGACKSQETFWVAKPELSLNSLHPLLSGLPLKEWAKQNGPGLLLGKERLDVPKNGQGSMLSMQWVCMADEEP